MKNIEEYIKKIASTQRMTAEESSRIKSRINHEMEAGNLVPRRAETGVFMFVRRHALSSVIVTVLFLSGTTGAVAEKALPGEILYPIKTEVNEQVLGWMASIQQQETEWSVRLAERRLIEAETIYEKKDFSDEIWNKHKERLEKEIAEAQISTGFSREMGEEDSAIILFQGDEEKNEQEEASLMMAVPSYNQSVSEKRVIQEKSESGDSQVFMYGNLYERMKKIMNTLKEARRAKEKRGTALKLEASLIAVRKEALDARRGGSNGEILSEINKKLDEIERKTEEMNSSDRDLSLERDLERKKNEEEASKLDEERFRFEGEKSEREFD